MIASIQGKIIHKGSDYLVINLGGIGLQLFTPRETYELSNIGDIKFFHTQLIVREDSLTLFGFENEIEKDYFILLLGVNGVGPRMALVIISNLSIDTINRAVATEMYDIFARVPGVGKKTAQKIAIHLQGKIKSDIEMLGLKTTHLDVDLEVMDALISLGYSVVEAQAAIQFIPKDTSDVVEERLRVALQYFT
ncbi:MAG TPA: Holliday junction branch migration protein RuvA [Anaerolineaceae bacterium]|nr:Holliday junction branch migration protein RuvA [Anaerolineaceae bacterium]